MRSSVLLKPGQPKRLFLTNVVVAVCMWISACAASEQPNIVLIMSDDMGFSDIGCYGSEIATPNLDSLAQDGIRFTQFYNGARCCPTRAALLTGLHPHQAGVGHMMSDRGHAGYRGDLNKNCRTIAEVLGPAGYETYMAGKWHVTKHIEPDGPKFNWPLQRGFKRFYGMVSGAGSFFDPKSLARNNTIISPVNDSEYQPEEYYFTDAISDHAVRFINDHLTTQKDRPFFLYVSYTAAHWPMHALPKDIAKYKGRYQQGFQAIRQQRLEKMKSLGLVAADCVLPEAAIEWESAPLKEWESRCMEVYAAMVDNMDQGIGRIVSTLKAGKAIDNTLIVFLQDNGGCAERLGRGKANAAARGEGSQKLPPLADDYLQMAMVPKQSRSGQPTKMGDGVMPGPDGTYIAYGKGWANVSNTPFREYKHWVHEGGISTPLIAHWPRKIKGGNAITKEQGQLVDLMATFVEVSGAEYPAQVGEHEIVPLPGTSLLPAMRGEKLKERPLFWEHEGNRAIRLGDWKLVAKGKNGPWELYDITNDRVEQNNVIKEHPEKASDLERRWQSWAERSQVLPLDPQPPREASKRKRFKLKPGQQLAGSKSPDIAKRGFRLTLDLASVGDGVLWAQGGSALGYALHVREGYVVFSSRVQGELTNIKSTQKLDQSTRNVVLSLQTGGEVSIIADGKSIAKSKLPVLVPRLPIDGMEVGRDDGGAVGNYLPGDPYRGRIRGGTLELLEK